MMLDVLCVGRVCVLFVGRVVSLGVRRSVWRGVCGACLLLVVLFR